MNKNIPASSWQHTVDLGPDVAQIWGLLLARFGPQLIQILQLGPM